MLFAGTPKLFVNKANRPVNKALLVQEIFRTALVPSGLRHRFLRPSDDEDRDELGACRNRLPTPGTVPDTLT